MGNVDDEILLGLAAEIGFEWERLAAALETSQPEIEQLRMDYENRGIVNCIHVMLLRWKQRQRSTTDQLSVLVEALQKCGRQDLADRLMSSSVKSGVKRKHPAESFKTVISKRRQIDLSSSSTTTEPSGDDSCSPVLSEERSSGSPQSFLKQCQKDLSHQYLQSLCKISLFPGDTENYLDMNDIYTNLSILIDLPSPMMPIKIPLESHNEIFTRKTDNGNRPTRILILGDAGCGKSTLIAKIAHDWSTKAPNSPIKDVPLLFALNMRWMDQRQTLEEAIFQQLLPMDTPITPTFMRNYIQENQESVYILLDSYDEFSGGQPIGKSAQGSIMQILANTYLKHCRVIITSRVWKAADFSRLRREYTKMEVKGFSNDNVNQYVERFFRNEKELGKSLLRYMEDNSLHSGIASVPLMTLLVCLYWKETQGEIAHIPTRLGELYTGIFSLMYKHYLTKEGAQIIDFDQVTIKLGRIALDGIWPPNNRLVFSLEEVSNATAEETVENACKVGLLSMEQVSVASQVGSLFKRDFVSRVNRSNINDKSLTFFHKTGQERCAAEFLAELETSNRALCEETLNRLASVESCFAVEMVLRFACGVNKGIAKMILQRLLQVYRSKLSADVEDYYHDNLSVEKTKHMQLFIELCLQCNYESGSTNDFNAVLKEIFPKGEMLFLGMSPYTNLAIQKYLQYIDSPQDVIAFSVSDIPRPGDEPWSFGSRKAMLDVLNTAQMEFKRTPEEELRRVFSEYTQRSDTEMDDFVNAIGVDIHRGVCYIELWDYFKQWQTTRQMNLRPILDSLHYVHLKTLDLSRVKLGVQIEKVIDIIEHGDLSFLQCLKLTDVGLTSHYAKQLLQAVKKALPSLAVLNLSKNKVGECLEDLVKYLPESLKELDVTLNKAPSQAMTALAQRLPMLPNLQSYRTYGNDMDNDAGCTLAENLRFVDKMVNIAISVSGLNWHTHRNLVTALGNLRQLEILSIANSPYPDDLLAYLAGALAFLKEIKYIYLRAREVKVQSPKDFLSSLKGKSGSVGTKPQEISRNSGRQFVSALGKMDKLRDLSLFEIRLPKDDFVQLIEICRKGDYENLGYHRCCLPDGLKIPQDRFLSLH